MSDNRLSVGVLRADLLRELGHAKNVVPKKDKGPAVLECVLIRATEADRLVIESTDVDRRLVSKIETAHVLAEGEALVPLAKLERAVRSLKDEELRITATDIGVEITQGTFRSNYTGLPPVEQFPRAAVPDTETSWVQGAQLARMIEQTRFACAAEPAGNWATHLVRLDVIKRGEKSRIRLVGADGHRVAFSDTEKFKAEPETRALLSQETLALLKALIEEKGAEFEYMNFGLSRVEDVDYVAFRLRNRTLVARVPPGQFPDVDRIVPQTLARRAVLGVETLREAVKRQSGVLAEQKKPISVLHFTPDHVVIRGAVEGEGETATETIEYVRKSEVDGFVVAIKRPYVADFLARAGTKDRVIISAQTNDSPMLFRLDASDHFSYLLMPPFMDLGALVEAVGETTYDRVLEAVGGAERAAELFKAAELAAKGDAEKMARATAHTPEGWAVSADDLRQILTERAPHLLAPPKPAEPAPVDEPAPVETEPEPTPAAPVEEKFYVNRNSTGPPKWQEMSGERFALEDIDLFVHPSLDAEGFTVTEGRTGMSIVVALKSADEAREAALARVATNLGKVREIIANKVSELGLSPRYATAAPDTEPEESGSEESGSEEPEQSPEPTQFDRLVEELGSRQAVVEEIIGAYDGDSLAERVEKAEEEYLAPGYEAKSVVIVSPRGHEIKPDTFDRAIDEAKIDLIIADLAGDRRDAAERLRAEFRPSDYPDAADGATAFEQFLKTRLAEEPEQRCSVCGEVKAICESDSDSDHEFQPEANETQS